jgi:hypothetical protein
MFCARHYTQYVMKTNFQIIANSNVKGIAAYSAEQYSINGAHGHMIKLRNGTVAAESIMPGSRMCTVVLQMLQLTHGLFDLFDALVMYRNPQDHTQPKGSFKFYLPKYHSQLKLFVLPDLHLSPQKVCTKDPHGLGQNCTFE